MRRNVIFYHPLQASIPGYSFADDEGNKWIPGQPGQWSPVREPVCAHHCSLPGARSSQVRSQVVTSQCSDQADAWCMEHWDNSTLLIVSLQTINASHAELFMILWLCFSQMLCNSLRNHDAMMLDREWDLRLVTGGNILLVLSPRSRWAGDPGVIPQ